MSDPGTLPSRLGVVAAHRLTSAVATAVAMLVLALWRLDDPGLWADELATWGATSLSLSQLAELVRNVDLVLAPYYVVMHFWTLVFGTSEVALRLPSVVAVTVAAALVADLGRRLWGCRAGWIAGLVFVAVPAVSRFGQEARPYALSMLAIVLAAWLTQRAVDLGGVRRDVLSAVSLGAAVALQPMTFLAAPAFAVQRAERPAGWFRWVALAGLAMSPGMAFLAWAQLHQDAAWAWIAVVPWADVLRRLTLIVGPPEAGVALLVLAVLGLRWKAPERWLALWALVPIASLLSLGMVMPVYVARLLAFTLAGLALLAAGVLSRLPLPVAVAAVAVAAGLGVSYQADIRSPAGHTQDSRLVADVLISEARPGDAAVYDQSHLSIPWSPRDIVAYYVPSSLAPRDVLALSPQRANGRFLADECTDLHRCLGLPRRVWVIRAGTFPGSIAGMDGEKSEYLRDHYDITRSWSGALVTVLLLERSAG